MAGNIHSQLVSAIKQRWRNGERADANEAFREHPQLRDEKSLALELAYEEYCLRASAGEAIDRNAFCKQFSKFQASLGRRLELHDLLDSQLFIEANDESIAWPEVGDVFCDYRLIEELGRGMVGRVFLAEDLSLANRQIVVKVTRAGITEAETLSRLAHRNIVPVYSIKHEELSGLTAIVMPFRGRHTLQDLLDVVVSGSLPSTLGEAVSALGKSFSLPVNVARLSYVDGVIAIGAQLCDALAHTHAKGVLHLDLKPSNILLSNDGEPQILDFNLSLDGASRWSLLGGTMPYMSPEQIRAFVLADSAQNLDARSDIYSLGVILYQLATGVHPFAGLDWRRAPEQVAADLLASQKQGAVLATSLTSEVSRSVAELLKQATTIDRDARPGTAALFKAALQRELGLRSRLKRQAYRHRKLGTAVALSVVVAASTAAALFASREPYTKRQTERGWALIAEREDDAALQAFDTAIKADPHNHEAYFGRGRVYQRLGKFDEAYEDFSQAHTYHKDPRYSACRGYSAAALARYDIAIARFNEAIQEGWDIPEVYICLGRTHLAMNQKVAAEQCFRKATEIAPTHSVAWHNLAILLQSQPGGASQARACMDQAIEGDAPHPKMFAAAAFFAWLDAEKSAKTDVKKYLQRGLQAGLAWRDCERAPFAMLIRSDNALVDALKASRGSKQPLLLWPDPLLDDAVSLRFAGIRQ